MSRINRQTRVSIFVSSPKGARYSSLSPSSFLFPLPFIPSIPFLLLHIRLLPSSFMSSPLLLQVCTQSQTSVAGKAKRRAGSGFLFFFFFKATRRRFNATGIMRPDQSYGFCSRSSRVRDSVNRDPRTSPGSSRRSLVSCWDLPLFLIKKVGGA